jgi:hypothetical protein
MSTEFSSPICWEIAYIAWRAQSANRLISRTTAGYMMVSTVSYAWKSLIHFEFSQHIVSIMVESAAIYAWALYPNSSMPFQASTKQIIPQSMDILPPRRWSKRPPPLVNIPSNLTRDIRMYNDAHKCSTRFGLGFGIRWSSCERTKISRDAVCYVRGFRDDSDEWYGAY